MVNRVILHVDLNSFFATAEQQANPALRGKPVGIIKAYGRTCVIAASVEAKRYGIKTGTDIFEAKRLCPKIILVPADFDKYADITFRFIDICRDYSPLCEVFSLDECFIDVTETEELWGNAFNIALEIKDRLRQEIGDYMTCSVGVSYNKLLSKLASSQIKPDGLFWITEDNALKVLDRSDLMDVCGLGFGLNNHLRRLGIDSFAKLRMLTLEFLDKHFGPYWSLHLYNIARGIDKTSVTSIVNMADAKSVGRTYTTHRDLVKRTEIIKLMRNLCEETARKARQMRMSGRYIGLSLRGKSNLPSGGGDAWFGHLTLKNYINDSKLLFDYCIQISKEWSVKTVRFCGVTLGMLTQDKYLPNPLLPVDQRRQDLVKAVDTINSRFGDYTLYPGQLLGMEIVRPEINGYFGDKKFRLNFLRKN